MRHLRPLLAAGLLGAALSSGGCRPAASPAPDVIAAVRAETLALRPYMGRLRTLPVRVGDDTLAMLFDTGGGWTLVSPELAPRLGCAPGSRSVGHRMSGERLEVPTCAGAALAVAGVATRPAPVGIFDLMRLLPKDWPRLDGVLSLHTFAGRALTLDLGANHLILESPASLAARTRDMTPLRVRLATGSDGAELVAFVAIATDSGEAWLELDSGNLDAVLLAPHAARALGLPDGWTEDDVALRLAPGTAPVVKARARELIHDGVLNAAFLERAVVTIDLASGRGWMQLADGARAAPPAGRAR